MGIFERIFGKKEKEEQKPPEAVKKEIDFESLEKIASGIEERELRIIEEKGVVIMKRLRDAVSVFKSGVTTLSDAQLTEEQKERDMRAYAIVRGSREEMIGQFSHGAELIRIPEKADRKALAEIDFSLAEFSNTIARNTKNIYYVSIMFGEQTENINQSLKMFDEIRKDISDCLNSDSFRLCEKIKVNVSEMRELYKLERKLAERQEEIKNIIMGAEERKKLAERELDEYKSSREYMECQKALSRISEIKNEIEMEKVRIRAKISPLMKPLRSLNRLEQDRRKSSLIEKYLENPAEAIIADGGLDEFKSILPELGSSVMKGMVKVQSEADVMKSINEITVADVLSAHVTRCATLGAELDELMKIEFNVPKQAEDAGNISGQGNMQELERELLRVQERMEKNQEAMGEIKRRLEGLLLMAGHDVRIA